MRKIDIIILIVCIFTVSVAFYDLTHLNQIQDKAIDRCNQHWIKEFETKCRYNEYTNPKFNFSEWNYSVD